MRRNRSEPGGHQVYLLDTMNNVLGILILALILTRLIFPQVEGNEGISKEAIAALKDKLAAIVLPDNPDKIDPTSVANQSRELQLLRDHLAAAVSGGDKIAAKREQLAQERIELSTKLAELLPGDQTKTKADIEESLSRMDESRAKLRESIRLATAAFEAAVRSAQVGADKVVDVSVPAAEGGVAVESAPQNSNFVSFVCFNGRIMPRNADALGKLRNAALAAVIKDKGGPDKTTFGDVIKHFENNDVGNEYFRMKMIPIRDGKGIAFLVRHIPRSGAGEKTEVIRAGQSSFEKQLRGLDQKTSVVLFKVFSDSFESYLDARKLADSLGLRCGWEPFGMDQVLQYRLGGSGGGSGPDIDSVRK